MQIFLQICKSYDNQQNDPYAKKYILFIVVSEDMGPLLLTWIDFDPGMDK